MTVFHCSNQNYKWPGNNFHIPYIIEIFIKLYWETKIKILTDIAIYIVLQLTDSISFDSYYIQILECQRGLFGENTEEGKGKEDDEWWT
jgi:hypothetical protein